MWWLKSEVLELWEMMQETPGFPGHIERFCQKQSYIHFIICASPFRNNIYAYVKKISTMLHTCDM